MAASPAVHGAALVAHDVGPICEARAFEIARRGQPTFEGGLAGLQAMFWSRLETFGADRREHLTPVEVVVRRGRVAGVRVRPRDETIGCHHLLWAGSAAALGAALAPDVVAPHKRPPAARVTGYRYSVAALVEPEALPADMPSRTLAIGDPSRPMTEDNAVAITVGPPMARDSRRDSDLGRMRRARPPGRGRTELPARAARARDPRVAPAAAWVRAAFRRARVALRRPPAPSTAARPLPRRRRRRRSPRCRRRPWSARPPSGRSTSSACRTRPR